VLTNLALWHKLGVRDERAKVVDMFNEEKVAQIAAYLLQKRGGQMSYLKLMKLMYLADRESMAQFEEPMSDDAWFSMDKGPVLSNVLNLIQGSSMSGQWDSWVAQAPEPHEVSLARPGTDRDSFDELSDADIDILDTVWKRLGGMTRWDLVKYTHSECSEWRDPNRSALPIPPQDVFRALGKTDEESDELAAEIFQRRELRSVLERLR
jgi:uncharacterized phage-associated protein